MIDLYYWPTPNGRKISIMLEECGLEYRVQRVDIGGGDQFSPRFLKIGPNNRMPAETAARFEALAHDRYANEYDRLLAVMDVRLRDREYLAGDYSIADMASFPWVMPYKSYGQDAATVFAAARHAQASDE